MRYQATATCLSWIPPTAVEGVFGLPFGLGVAHYDQPPPDELPDVGALLSADAIRFATNCTPGSRSRTARSPHTGCRAEGSSDPPRSGCGLEG